MASPDVSRAAIRTAAAAVCPGSLDADASSSREAHQEQDDEGTEDGEDEHRGVKVEDAPRPVEERADEAAHQGPHHSQQRGGYQPYGLVAPHDGAGDQTRK